MCLLEVIVNKAASEQLTPGTSQPTLSQITLDNLVHKSSVLGATLRASARDQMEGYILARLQQSNMDQINCLVDLVSEDEVMWDSRGYDGDSEKGKAKDEMSGRGEDPSSGEVLRYFDGEPDFFA